MKSTSYRETINKGEKVMPRRQEEGVWRSISLYLLILGRGDGGEGG